MSDIISKFWLNIEVLQYPSYMEVNRIDASGLEESSKSYLKKAIVATSLTVLFSVSRGKLIAKAKGKLLKGNKVVNDSKTFYQPYDQSVFNKAEPDYVTMQGGSVSSRGKDESIKVRVNFPEKKQRELFYAGLGKNIEKPKGTLVRKLFRNDSSDSKQRVENFLVNSRIVYLPLLLLLAGWTYGYAVELVGYYVKYQPLADEFERQRLLI